ncbi:hypothetical protein GH714_006648 [Hevea brasiliensis]|uniref:Uncharacterized protein n=1 Tax=Hevea brasiliensis TaxID=3981 RepID=A0A6A6KQE0_HEVBR|nr:hypothetical protein GH714_006648 [Hevea brasiliensis]
MPEPFESFFRDISYELLVLVMVRSFPVYHSQIRDEWHNTMEAKPPASLHVEQVISPVRLICQKIHAPHPLGVFYGENPLDYSFSLVLFEIILIVLISRVVRFILKPLKQPRIVSDILGGIIIGPSVLGQSPSFTRIVFPENSVFLVQNVGIMGFMYFLFLAGVKMDLTLIRKSGKKHVYIAMIGMIVPAVFVAIVGVILRSSLDKELARVSGIGAVATDLAFTSFPVIYLVLKELNLLSSEVGRMALAVAVIGDSLGIFVIIAFEAMKQGEVSTQGAAWYFISTAVIDMFGLAIANGSLWFGLVVPDGPPLGATIVERSETIVMEILMPFAFAFTVTAISAPFVSILYNPTRPYMINRRRTIQHNPPGKELRTVVCIYDEENVAGIIDLLEVSYPTITSPFTIYALHLVELVGRATPLFIDHEESDEPLKKNTEQETIYNALKIYQEARRDFVKLHFFTALAIKRTMYQDICELALSNKASLIILPFEKGRLDTLPGTEIVRHGHGIKSISSNVIAHAPCSVGILIDKGHVHNPFMLHPLGQSTYHNYVMLFLGGADAREALSYADRMIMNPEVSLIVVRFLAYNNEGDDEIEKKLDDG